MKNMTPFLALFALACALLLAGGCASVGSDLEATFATATAAPVRASFEIKDARFSPDGKRVVTVVGDNTAQVWDAATGERLVVLSGHDTAINSASFSSDGSKIVTASYDGTARVWDAQTAKELVRLSGHKQNVLSAQFSPSDTQIVTSSQDGTTRVWNAATGKEVFVLGGHRGDGASALYSPDGSKIVTVSDDPTASLQAAATGKLIATLSGHKGPIWNVAFNPAGTRLLTSSGDNTVRVWDTETGKELVVLAGFPYFINTASFSPDGKRILTATNLDAPGRVWDAETGKELFALKGGTSGAFRAIYSPSGKEILTTAKNGGAQVWDAETGKEVAVLGRDAGDAMSGLYSPGGDRILTLHRDGSVRVWDAAARAQVALLQAQKSSAEATATAAFTPPAVWTWRMVLADPFDRASNDWTVGSYDTDGFANVMKVIERGKYQWTLTSKEAGKLNRDIPNYSSGDNFAVTVEGAQKSGPDGTAYGLVFRDNYSTFYLFQITDQGAYKIAAGAGEKAVHTLLEGTSDAIRAGKVNRIQVVATGSHYAFYVNDQLVGEMNDDTLDGSKVGLAVQVPTANLEARVEFDDFEVRAP